MAAIMLLGACGGSSGGNDPTQLPTLRVSDIRASASDSGGNTTDVEIVNVSVSTIVLE